MKRTCVTNRSCAARGPLVAMLLGLAAWLSAGHLRSAEPGRKAPDAPKTAPVQPKAGEQAAPAKKAEPAGREPDAFAVPDGTPEELTARFTHFRGGCDLPRPRPSCAAELSKPFSMNRRRRPPEGRNERPA